MTVNNTFVNKTKVNGNIIPDPISIAEIVTEEVFFNEGNWNKRGCHSFQVQKVVKNVKIRTQIWTHHKHAPPQIHKLINFLFSNNYFTFENFESWNIFILIYFRTYSDSTMDRISRWINFHKFFSYFYLFIIV